MDNFSKLKRSIQQVENTPKPRHIIMKFHKKTCKFSREKVTYKGSRNQNGFGLHNNTGN